MSEAMTIEQAKSLSGALMRLMFAREGLGDISEEQLEMVKNASLVDLLTANTLMVGYKEQLEGGGNRHFMKTTDVAIAELYCRLHKPGFRTVEDVESLAEAYEQVKEDADNGFAVLIDSNGYSTIIELNDYGNGGQEIQSAVSFSELYSWVHQQVNS